MLQMGESKTRLTCEDNGLISVEYKTCVYILVSQAIVCWRRECVCVFEYLPGLFLVALVEDIGAFVDVVDFEVEGKVLVYFVKVSL